MNFSKKKKVKKYSLCPSVAESYSFLDYPTLAESFSFLAKSTLLSLYLSTFLLCRVWPKFEVCLCTAGLERFNNRFKLGFKSFVRHWLCEQWLFLISTQQACDITEKKGFRIFSDLKTRTRCSIMPRLFFEPFRKGFAANECLMCKYYIVVQQLKDSIRLRTTKKIFRITPIY